MIQITSKREIVDSAVEAADASLALIRKMQRTGKLPARLTQSTIDAMERSLNKYFSRISDDKIQEFADKAREVVEQTLKTEQEVRPGKEGTTTVGTGTGEARSLLTDFIEEHTGANVAQTMNMDFFQRIAREVAEGAGQHIAQNMDQTRVDEYPALELVRVYEREVPRGEKRGPHGSIISDPEDSWEARWQAAAEQAGDDDALRILSDESRMVALKSSDIWQALGDGAGGYDDTLGNPFAPFAFNSGMDTDEVSREDAVALELLQDDDTAEGATLDFNDLVALPTEASRALMCGAPLGNDNASKNHVKQTETKEFKAWFGDSKIVDGEGKPLVVYHGTTKDFESFDDSKRAEGNYGVGHYFTQNPWRTSAYAGEYSHYENGRVIPAFVKIEHPADAETAHEYGEDTEAMEKSGYDGIISGDTIVPFHANQIKSAIGNSGKFDPKDPRITASRACDTLLHALLNASMAHRELSAEASTDEGGVWRTIRGTPIFIKEGEDIGEAIKEKFQDKQVEKGVAPVSSKMTREQAMELFRHGNMTYDKSGEKIFNEVEPGSLSHRDFREIIHKEGQRQGTTSFSLRRFTSDDRYEAINRNPNGFDSRRLLRALEKEEPYKGGSLHRSMMFSGAQETNEFVNKLFTGEKTVTLDRTLTSFSESEGVTKQFAKGNFTVQLEMTAHHSAREIGDLSSWKASNEKEIVLLNGSKLKYDSGTLESGPGFAHYHLKVHEV